MAFNSIQYMIFLPIVFTIYWLCPDKFKNIILLVASYVFYSSWNLKYSVLILFSTVSSWIISLIIAKTENRGRKERFFLFLGVVSNLLVLLFFKYFNFFSESIFSIASYFNLGDGSLISLKYVLPVGISFYTFQSLSYVIDVYRKDCKAEKNIVTYALYISFFPQLVAGPIERASNILPQLNAKRSFNYNQAVEGTKMILWGLLKKICISDFLAIYVDNVYNDIHSFSGPTVVLATLFFSIQIYCDFSAYSDIAIGSAKLVGVELMKNFNCPYFSSSIQEFWSRWHISLSQWFRDYVYIPLGGNRCSKGRNYFNLFVTFLISGLWHGANWTFVLWGCIHGILQIVEKHFRFNKKNNKNNTVKKALTHISVFLLITMSWVFFRANTISDAIDAFSLMFKGWNLQSIVSSVAEIGMINMIILLIGIVLLIIYDCLQYRKVSFFDLLSKTKTRWLIYYSLVVFVFITFLYYTGEYGSSSQFIYFQF